MLTILEGVNLPVLFVEIFLQHDDCLFKNTDEAIVVMAGVTPLFRWPLFFGSLKLASQQFS
ncbi:MAG: hypothetical protein NXI04_22090 [Planctomycetaceae bacterium]|nr:hypothetical protein [Planctomycetaceae bacterium]